MVDSVLLNQKKKLESDILMLAVMQGSLQCLREGQGALQAKELVCSVSF